MRARFRVKTSLESPLGTAPSRREPEGLGSGALWVLLAILAGALVLLALWGTASRRGDTSSPNRTSVNVSQRDPSVRAGSTRTTPQDVRAAAPANELNNVSVDTPSIDAAFLTGLAVVVSLASLSWLLVFGAQLRPGITFGLFVPG